FLHVFSRRKGLRVVWPQGGGHAVVDRRGEFSVLTTLGEPRDKGQEFEIVAAVLDAAENAKIDAWFKRADETGRYPGIALPSFIAGCGAPAQVTVIKTE